MGIWIFATFAIAGLVTFLSGVFWAISSRGQLEVREGADVHRELVAGQARRDARVEGQQILAQKTWSKGVGKSVGGETSISMEEIVLAWRRGDRATLLPWLTAAGGAAMMLASCAVALILAGEIFLLVGVAFLVIGVRIVLVCRRGLLKAARELDTEDEPGRR